MKKILVAVLSIFLFLTGNAASISFQNSVNPSSETGYYLESSDATDFDFYHLPTASINHYHEVISFDDVVVDKDHWVIKKSFCQRPIVQGNFSNYRQYTLYFILFPFHDFY